MPIGETKFTDNFLNADSSQIHLVAQPSMSTYWDKIINMDDHRIIWNIRDKIDLKRNQGFDFKSDIHDTPNAHCSWYNDVISNIDWGPNPSDKIRAEYVLMQLSYSLSHPPRLHEGPQGGVTIEAKNGDNIITAIFEDDQVMCLSSSHNSYLNFQFDFKESTDGTFEMIYRLGNEYKLLA